MTEARALVERELCGSSRRVQSGGRGETSLFATHSVTSHVRWDLDAVPLPVASRASNSIPKKNALSSCCCYFSFVRGGTAAAIY